jgi:hypothetical protein
MDPTDLDTLIPLDEAELDLLAWFAAWVPAMHSLAYSYRRRWPPGFREIKDVSDTYKGHAKWVEAERSLAIPPHHDGARRRCERLLAYRCLEGSVWHALRLTPRGRAALKLANRACSDRFLSHSDVFDDVSLLPPRGAADLDPHTPMSPAPPPDEMETWRRMCLEYREGDYQGRHTLTRSSARISSASGLMALNGSTRMHHGWIRLVVENEHHGILEIDLSREQLTDLLTSNSSTPVTIGLYVGSDGMRRSLPAPPPLSISDRMRRRIGHRMEKEREALDALAAKVEAANMAKGLKAEIQQELSRVRSHMVENTAYAAEESMEEVSAAVESLLSISRERFVMAGLDPAMLIPQDAAGAMRQIEAPSTFESDPPGGFDPSTPDGWDNSTGKE